MGPLRPDGRLARQLAQFMQGLLDRTDAETAAAMRAGVCGFSAKGALRIGDTAPPFALPDQTGRIVGSAELLAAGPLVVTFFRGNWCPFCTLALRALNGVIPLLRKEGARVVAISPQSARDSETMAERNGIDFPLLSDPGNTTARDWGVEWEVAEALRPIYAKLGHPARSADTPDAWRLPLPSGFVVRTDGRIDYAQVELCPSLRMEPDDAVAAVRRLRTPAAQTS